MKITAKNVVTLSKNGKEKRCFVHLLMCSCHLKTKIERIEGVHVRDRL